MSIPVSTFVRAIARTVVAAMLVFAPALAASDEDLPGRVGRLADTAGDVYVATEERAEDWVEAFRNYTITSGDNVWVSGDGRAEIDYGGGQIRLAGDTNIHVSRLDDRVLALFIAHGRVIVRLRVLDPGEAAHIDTPNTQLTLTRPGLYRIDVTPDRTRTELVVRQGEATVALANAVQQVLPGQTALVEGEDADFADVRTGYAVDGFDTWSADRDRRYERSRTATYVSRQMIGYADLDDHGRWESSVDYGPVWYPTTVVAGWAPYRYGRWSWVGGWGWTWVDDAPWGYAPFHYGRWVFAGNRWGWCPGTFVARPLWAPALVGWYGGSGWSVSASFGTPVYGWVPLGWGEPFVPWWRNCSDRCWTGYNRPYAVNRAERRHAPPTRYVNWSAPGGVTAVAGATFTGRLPVHTNVVAIRPGNVSNAPVLAQAPVVAKPSPATIRGARPPAGVAPVPAAVYRTKPLQVAPSAPAASPSSGSVRATPSRGAGTTAAPRTLTPPSGVAKPGVAPSQPVAPSSAAPASPAYPAARAPQSNPYRQGTWGAPSGAAPSMRAPSATAPSAAAAPVPAPAVAAPRPEGRVPQAVGPAVRPIEPRASPSSQGQRAVPPQSYTPPQSHIQRGTPIPAQPAYAPPSQIQRGAPPSAQQAYAPPGAGAPSASGPPAIRGAPAAAAPSSVAPSSVAPPAVAPERQSVRGGGQAVPVKPGRDSAGEKPNPQR